MTSPPEDRRPSDIRSSPRFSGIATLLRAPLGNDPHGLDVALCGVPFDGGSTFRAGSRHGPAQIREMSRLIRHAHPVTRVDPFAICRVSDIGDVSINPLDAQASLEAIERFFGELALAGATPLAAGGDHTVTLPILRALAADQPVGLIQLDAHSDTQDEMMGARIANGTPIRRAIEEGLVDPARTIQVGIRGTLFAPDEHDWATEAGVTMIPMEAIRERGPRAIGERCVETVGEGPTYVSFDIDVLDPAFAPGTGGLEPGGMTVLEAQQILRGLGDLDLIGADVVEVSPPLDPGTTTALAASSLMFELLCLMAR